MAGSPTNYTYISFSHTMNRDVPRFRRVVATIDMKCSINVCAHILEVILYCLVTNSGVNFKLSGGYFV